MWLQLLTTSSVANVHLYLIAYRFTVQTCYLHLKHDKTDEQTEFDNYVLKMYIITSILTANVRDSTSQLWADGQLAMATQCSVCICWHRGGHGISSSSSGEPHWRPWICTLQWNRQYRSRALQPLLLLLWPPLNEVEEWELQVAGTSGYKESRQMLKRFLTSIKQALDLTMGRHVAW